MKTRRSTEMMIMNSKRRRHISSSSFSPVAVRCSRTNVDSANNNIRNHLPTFIVSMKLEPNNVSYQPPSQLPKYCTHWYPMGLTLRTWYYLLCLYPWDGWMNMLYHLTHTVWKPGTRESRLSAVGVELQAKKKNKVRIIFRAGLPFYFFCKKTAKMLRALFLQHY